MKPFFLATGTMRDVITALSLRFTQRGNFTPDGTYHRSLHRLVCGACYIRSHKDCDGTRGNGESCECRRCGDDAEGGALAE